MELRKKKDTTMIFYGSEFFILKDDELTEDRISITIDDLIREYQDKYFGTSSGLLANIEARWCVFYASDYTPAYFYCFTLVEFQDEKQLNHFKLKYPKLYAELRESGLAITIKDIESKLCASAA